MAFRISGFASGQNLRKEDIPTCTQTAEAVAVRKSLVQIRFPGRGMALTYYNDQFDLKAGDLVYVDGKLEGHLGRVTEVSYNFKIKLSDYQRVIALVDTNVHGEFFVAGSHFVTFDPEVLPPRQAIVWFKAPSKADDEFASGHDDSAFPLDDLTCMKVNSAIAERGQGYFLENRVRYLCLRGHEGLAVVEGSESYLVEFEYRSGQIRNLVCECPCGYTCKHEVAAMLQLRETLELIDQHYSNEYERTGYFAAVNKGTLFTFAVDGKKTGRFTL